MPYLDITGKRFGRLVAVEIVAEKYKRTKWLCKCDCGKEKLIPLDSLTSGKGISCGCYRKEVVSKKFNKDRKSNKRLYRIWLNMRNRCTNEQNPSYKNYGKRGIKVCKDWDEYDNFLEWSMNNGYKKDLTIDRIDNDGNYCASNCRWVTREIQMNNTTKNVFTKINGVTRTLSNHAKKYGLNYDTLHYRYEIGLRDKELIGPVKKRAILINIDGEIKSLMEWSRIYKLSYGTVQYRYNKGLRSKDLFGPVNKIKSQNANKRKKGTA